jgi:predicted transcriptional regulator of viral defense system
LLKGGKMIKNDTKQYLSPRETEVIARLSYEKATLVTQQQFDQYFKFPKSIRGKVIFRLKKKGILNTVKKGVYFYSPLESGPAGSNINEFLVPPVFFPRGNYYIGFSTMYNYYGFTDQIFQIMYILNTSLQREKTIGGMQFKMIKVSKTRMYGIEKIATQDTEVSVSDRERTMVDLIYFPEPVGGLKKAFEILKEQSRTNKTDITKLIRYTVRFPNPSLRKRIGFVLEQAGVKDKELEPLLKSIKKSSLVTLYPPKSRAGRINKKWKVIENAS